MPCEREGKDMDQTGQRLLKECLDHPNDRMCKLVYADWLEEQPWGESHAALVRKMTRCNWTVFSTQEGSLSATFWGYPIEIASYVRAEFQPMEWLAAEPTLQRWKWRLVRAINDHPSGDSGRAPNLHNAMRRGLQALLTCHRKKCICGRDVRRHSGGR